MDPITSDNQDHPTETVNNIFCYRAKATEETSITIQSRQSSLGRAHKVAHNQFGSQVSLPFSPSIPCMAGRLENSVHKWQTITSDQWMLFEGSLLNLLQNQLNFLYQTSTDCNTNVAVTTKLFTDLASPWLSLWHPRSPSVREVAVAFLVSCMDHFNYRQLELDKVMALRARKGDFNALMTLSETSKSDLQWWISHTHTHAHHCQSGIPW